MSSYGGVTFDVVMPGQGETRPDWAQRPAVTRRIVPYANREDVQSAGRGNFRITVPVMIVSSSGLATLQAAAGVTLATLTDLFGATHSNVALVDVGEPDVWENEDGWFVDLTFERIGS